jgi:hypothetical protein
VLLLAYHCNVASKPWEDDLLATDDSQDRLDYNGFTYVPFAKLNGSGSSYSSITASKINEEYQKQEYFTFDVTGALTGTDPHACDITVKVTATDDYSAGSQVNLFTAIVEDNLNYDDVYGSPAENGLDDYSHILRKLLPASSGESLGTEITAGETSEFTYSYTNDETYQNYENIRVITFVQVSGTREILGVFQTADHPFQVITDVTVPLSKKAHDKLAITSIHGTEISFTVPSAGNVTLALHSLNGQLIQMKQYNALTGGSQVISLGNLVMQNRCYIVTVANDYTHVSKRIIPVK